MIDISRILGIILLLIGFCYDCKFLYAGTYLLLASEIGYWARLINNFSKKGIKNENIY